MKVLVTGATGFIGRSAVRALAGQGAAVRCLLRPGSERAVLSGVECELAEGDLCDPASLEKALDGCATVLHLGAETSPASAARLRAVNVRGTEHLARLAASCGIERFVYLSTLSRAGAGAAAPRGWARLARSKLDGEKAARERLPAIVLRSAPCFGPGDHLACPLLARLRRSRLVTTFTGQGTFQTQPIWVEDLAGCLAAAALGGKAGEGARELAGPEELSVMEFWDLLAGALSVFRVRVHLPETVLRPLGFPLARALGRADFLRLAEFFMSHSAAEKNFAPALLGRPMVTVREEGIAKMLGQPAPAAGAGAEAGA